MQKPAPTEAALLSEIKARWSPRALDSERQIPPELLQEILEAARWAPSCFNAQPWRFLIFPREAQLRSTVEAHLLENNYWAKQASVLIVIAAEKTFEHNGKPNRYAFYDTGAAVMSLLLQAQHRGLASHQMAGFQHEELSRALALPESAEIISLLALGYASEELEGLNEAHRERELAPRSRKAVAELARFDSAWKF